MRYRGKISTWCVLLIGVTACTTQPVIQVTGGSYAVTSSLVLADVLPPPPIPGSVADQRDLQSVLHAQATRTPAQVAEAQRQADPDVFDFQPVMGHAFTANNLPVTAAFFAKVEHDEKSLVYNAKDFYGRPRPFVNHVAVKPTITPLPQSQSYPSGHSCFAYIMANLLSRMQPTDTQKIYAFADRFAQNRIIAGVHYPTDIAAGRIAASVIVSQLLQDPQFQADFQRAKDELNLVLPH